MKTKRRHETNLTPTQAQLEKLCREWQHVLRLDDWRIRVVLAELGDLAADVMGRCIPTVKMKTARVIVAPLSILPKDEHALADPIEVTLLHELVHLHLTQLNHHDDKEHAKIVIEEQAVEAISWALFRTKYPKYRDPYTREK